MPSWACADTLFGLRPSSGVPYGACGHGPAGAFLEKETPNVGCTAKSCEGSRSLKGWSTEAEACWAGAALADGLALVGAPKMRSVARCSIETRKPGCPHP